MSHVKFSFFLKDKKNSQNQHPIVLSISMNYQRTQMYTSVWVEKSKWNHKNKTIKGKDEESVTKNDTLLSILTRCRQISNELTLKGLPFNPNTIKEKLKYGFTNSKGLLESYQVFLDRMDRQIPSKYTKSTWVKYKNTYTRLQEFIHSTTQRKDIFLYELNTEFMEEFDLWIREKYKVSHNTIYKTFQRFSRFLKQEISRGNMEKFPFPDYSIKMIQKQGHYLRFDDIQKLENTTFDLPRLNVVKYLFLFSVYTGMSYIDLKNLKEKDLFQDENGRWWINTFRQKTKSRISVPLISNSLKYLNILRSPEFEYIKDSPDKLLPVKNNVHLNLEIKQVCELSGVRDPNKVTWYSSRRSTSVLFTKLGIPVQILQKVLSHKSLSTSLNYYVPIDDQMVLQSMDQLDKRLNNLSED